MQVSGSAIDASQASEHLTDLRFSDLSLSEGLQRGIAEAGFAHCTPIQSKALPLALDGHDVAGQAQTGTGKTAAYLIALFHRLDTQPVRQGNHNDPRALVLAPTRELAVQIHADATALGKHLPYKLGLVFGGTDYDKQRNELAAGVDVLIGTPGRIIDYFKQHVFGLRRVQVLVLDEADRMFDLGFIKDIRYVLRRLPDHEHRLNLLFSATLSYRVLELAYEHMNDPELVRIEPDKMTVDRVTQCIYFPSNEEKFPLLLTLLKERDPHRTMIFVNTRREADRRARAGAEGRQARALDEMLQGLGVQLERCVALRVDEDAVVSRLLGRAQIEGRSDDNEETIRNRMRVYREQTAPLVSYYRDRGVLVEVDGMGSIDAVAAAIDGALA